MKSRKGQLVGSLLCMRTVKKSAAVLAVMMTMIFCLNKPWIFVGVLGIRMPDFEDVYRIDVRDVVDHMKDKCYHNLGEAFESFFYMFYEIDEVGYVKLIDFE